MAKQTSKGGQAAAKADEKADDDAKATEAAKADGESKGDESKANDAPDHGGQEKATGDDPRVGAAEPPVADPADVQEVAVVEFVVDEEMTVGGHRFKSGEYVATVMHHPGVRIENVIGGIRLGRLVPAAVHRSNQQAAGKA